MGLWDNVKKVGKVAFSEGQNVMDRSQGYTQEMPMKTDEDLFRIIRNELKDSPMKAGAAKKELENRGYNHDAIMAKVR